MSNLSIIDLVVIIILVLGVIFGFFSGFSKKRLSTFASECGFIVAYFVGGPASHGLSLTGLTSMITNGYNSLFPTTEAFTTAIEVEDIAIRKTQLSTAMSELHIPSFFQSFFLTRVTDTSSSVGIGLASSFSYFTILISTYIILFLLTFILIRVLLSPLWKEGSVFGENGKTLVGRIFGIVRMVVKATMFIFTIMIILVLVSNLMAKFGNTFLLEWIETDLKMSDASGFSLGRLFYNTVESLFGWIANTSSETTALLSSL